MNPRSGPPSLGDLASPTALCVFPPSLSFYVDDSTSHQRPLKVYNPCDCAVRYRVLCTAARRYDVIKPDGVIKAHGTIDITIRHRDIKKCTPEQVDKFRLQVYDQNNRVIGWTTLTSTVHSTRERSPTLQGGGESLRSGGVWERFDSLPSTVSRQSSQGTGLGGVVRHEHESYRGSYDLSAHRGGVANRYNSGPHWIVILVGVVCAAVLALPSPDDKSTIVPEYLHCSYQYKIVAAYFLGIVSMVIFTTSNAGR